MTCQEEILPCEGGENTGKVESQNGSFASVLTAEVGPQESQTLELEKKAEGRRNSTWTWMVGLDRHP